MGPRDLCVVIPTRDRLPILRRTLDALLPQCEDVDVVVVLDGEDQRVPEVEGVRFLNVPHGGPGLARNRGVEATDRALILFLGDDMVPDPRLVRAHLGRHATEPDPTVAVQGTIGWHPESAAAPLNRWLDREALQFDFRSIPAGGDAGWGRFYSSNVSLKRELFEKAGRFDADFSYYYEDLDLAWRLDEAGLVLRYEPGAAARHVHTYDLPRLEARFEGVARGEFLMAGKHSGFDPFFVARLGPSRRRPAVPAAWAALDRFPWPAPFRRRLIPRADAYYRQRVARAFFEGWDSELDLAELKEYLGPDYDPGRFADHRRAVEEEEEAATGPEDFYRTSTSYLYDLTAFARWPTKRPYRAAVRRFTPPGGRLLDYGCGIGSDGLRLAADGFRVAFADYDNPSTTYLRWRLARRGLELPVHDIEDSVPGGFDLAYSFDVIEHVADPMAFLGALEERASMVAVNLLESDPEDTHLHADLPIGEILGRARRHGMLHHSLHHGRSHLVIYRSPGRRTTVRNHLRSALHRTVRR